MKEVDVSAVMGLTEKDNNVIMSHNDHNIGMTIDEFGRVYNEGGQYIADAKEVEPGHGIGCW